MPDDAVLYVYRCAACGSRGERHLAGDGHDGAEARCATCGGAVTLEWDGGVVLEAAPRGAAGRLVTHLAKGVRVRANRFAARPPGSVALAGVQVKVEAALQCVEGVVTHVRGDNPTAPTSIGVWILTDAGEEIVTDARNIVAVWAGTSWQPAR